MGGAVGGTVGKSNKSSSAIVSDPTPGLQPSDTVTSTARVPGVGQASSTTSGTSSLATETNQGISGTTQTAETPSFAGVSPNTGTRPAVTTVS